MCKYCILHGKGNKWFHHVDNFAKNKLDDTQRLELARTIYLDTARSRGYNSSFLFKYKMMLTGIPLLLKIPVAKYAIRPVANRLVEQYHVGQVCSLEEASTIIDKAGNVALFDCWCRHNHGTSQACCMGVGAFGDLAEEIPELRYINISPEKAKEIMEQYEYAGCFHSVWTIKPPFISTICNCDTKVCHGIEGLRLGVPSALLKGHKKAITRLDTCNGCGLCISVCSFNARFEIDGSVMVDDHACFGCGICISVCPQGAITMEER